MRLNPRNSRDRLREESSDNDRGEYLAEENAVDLAHEGLPDLRGALGHCRTILEVVGDITGLGLVKYSAATVAGAAEKRLLSFVS